ncbi:MAG TPA: LLM class flavin-dependent oxidoreductase, partial [Thermoanaerobaculia bacterium]
ARWSEQCGCTGMLVYSDNSIPDAWLIAQQIISSTKTLAPMIAVQPVYMHPYAAAKMVASLAWLHRRRVLLNMVAGGFRNDLEALNDTTAHDDRYSRLVEYTDVILALLRGAGPVSYAGKFYEIRNLRMTPAVSPDLVPEVFVSGSSDAGLAAAAALGATAVRYPKPSQEEAVLPTGDWGLRVGIIARRRASEAWDVARERFPEDRRGQLTHELAMRVSDSQWHRDLSDRPAETPESPYWLVPFQHYKTMCPYLVGSIDDVADEIARYIDLGFRKFILDIPPSLEDLVFTTAAFSRATEPVLR